MTDVTSATRSGCSAFAFAAFEFFNAFDPGFGQGSFFECLVVIGDEALVGDCCEALVFLAENMGFEEEAVFGYFFSPYAYEGSVRESHGKDVFAVVPGEDDVDFVKVGLLMACEGVKVSETARFCPAQIDGVVDMAGGIHVAPENGDFQSYGEVG